VTYSLVARDAETGELGVAVQSRSFGTGRVVPWAAAGVGAVATQSFSLASYGPLGLASLRAGAAPGEALAELGGRFLVLIDDTYTDVNGKEIAPKQLDDIAWQRLIDTTHRVADIAQDRFGLVLTYHPHAETHVEYEEQIEALYA